MTLTLATFNVKDYFESPRNLPRARGQVRRIAAQLARADADVVALQEVGSRRCSARCSRACPGARRTRSCSAAPIAAGSATRSSRGWPCSSGRCSAPSPSPSRCSAAATPPFAGRLPLRRGVVRVALRALGLPIHVFCMHWKSKLPKAEEDEEGSELDWTSGTQRAEADLRSLVSRSAEALFVRAAIERSAAGGAEVVVMGDLNDTLDSVPVRVVLGSGFEPSLHAAAARADERPLLRAPPRRARADRSHPPHRAPARAPRPWPSSTRRSAITRLAASPRSTRTTRSCARATAELQRGAPRLRKDTPWEFINGVLVPWKRDPFQKSRASAFRHKGRGVSRFRRRWEDTHVRGRRSRAVTPETTVP
ncbi:MAG: endonuclease/exonuclease/phosphatase family protein [Myxococcales bacterium]|nr:endonuclease/exonuclease/phosphatase family protein [Myxococcales bacterium]